MMGDLVLLEDEVNPVMSALLDHGFDVTALHNHFFFESPRIFYMHVHGHGKADDLANRVKPAIDLIGRGSPQHQSSATGGAGGVTPGQIDTAKIAEIVGRQGEQNGPVYKNMRRSKRKTELLSHAWSFMTPLKTRRLHESRQEHFCSLGT